MADNADYDTPGHNEPSDGGYRPLRHMDESLFPNNDGDFASCFMQPRGQASGIHHRPLAANPPPWEDPDQAWRYVDGKVWTGEAFVYPRRTQPETRVEKFSPLASGGFSATTVPENHRRIQTPRGSHGFSGIGFGGEQQVPGGLQERGAGPPSQDLVSASTRTAQDSLALAQNTAKDSSPINKSQFLFTGWNDDAKRELFMWKMKRKKGYAFFLHLFPGETAESLHEAFREHKEDGERLYNI